MKQISQENRLIWLNGSVLPVCEAKINVLSPTAQFGANVFEGIRCYYDSRDNQLFGFRLKDHYDRLQRSIGMLRLDCPWTMEECEHAMIEVIRANDFREDIAVRQTVFVDGFGSWFATEPCGMFIAPIAKSRKKAPLTEGERTLVASVERISKYDMSPKAKVGANYINSRYAKLEAADKGFDSALFLNREGTVSEGPGSCFFIVKDGELITPSLEDSVLESITRDSIIIIAREELGIKVTERHIQKEELYTCDEAFFCGSAVEVSPVVQIDDYKIKDEKPGELTVAIHRKYLDVVTGKVESYRDWITPIY